MPVSLHLDHVEDDDLLRRAADVGISSVMYDASKLDYDKNVEATRAAREWAHANGLYLEAELGEVGGKDGAHAPGVRTDPGEAAEFVAATGVDALAVAVGSSHAMTDRSAALDHALIAELARAVPVPLVLHGSSGVPDDELARRGAGGHGQDQHRDDPERRVHRRRPGGVGGRRSRSSTRASTCDPPARASPAPWRTCSTC